MADELLDKLPENVAREIPDTEKIELCLKGTNKEWLICTTAKLYIIKKGFMTGHTFGSGIYQMPYKNITGVQTEYHALSGYFQVSTGGMADKPKDYWGKGADTPQESPNCVTITGKILLARFRSACDFINNKIADAHVPLTAAQAPSAADELKKFADLHAQGILTDEEFTAKKKQLLGI